MKYTTCERSITGAVTFILTEVGTQAAQAITSDPMYEFNTELEDEFFQEVLDEHDFETVTAEETGSLTNSPLFASGVERDDHGDLITLDHIWYDNEYAYRHSATRLVEHGEVRFTRADQD